ncbi:MAG: hypothetical protein OXN97_20460 [Bryobacterales bacterium]|nr:hypothetical protein [Bryobacterales bacterium]
MTSVINDDMKLCNQYTNNEEYRRSMPNTVLELAAGRGGAQ